MVEVKRLELLSSMKYDGFIKMPNKSVCFSKFFTLYYLETYPFHQSPPQPPQNAKVVPLAPHSIPRNFFCSSQSAGSPTLSVASEICSGKAPMIAR